MALSSDGTRALVGDPLGPSYHGAVYSFASSGGVWGTSTRLTNPAGSRALGTSIALSAVGTTALVGDPTGGRGTGAATVYTYAAGTWTPVTLSAPVGQGAFGTSVALTGSGTGAVVGDPTGAGGTGAATSYTLSGGAWSAGTPLAPPVGTASFGTSVATSSNGSTALVGDPLGGPFAGAVTVYSSDWTGWSLGAGITTPASANSVGTTVALSEDASTVAAGDPYGGPGGTGTGVVSTYGYDGTTTTTGPTPAPPAGAVSFGTAVALSADGRTLLVGDPGVLPFGAATVYTRQGSSWSAGTPLALPGTANSFGTAVALSADGTTALVGDPQGGDSATGAATLFTFDGTSWSAGTPLPPPAATLTFGTAVALSADGTTALVGDPSLPGGGSVSAFGQSNGSWSPGTVLALPAHSSAFGTALALSGGVALVGDPTGGASGTGAASVFTEAGTTWSAGTPLTPVGKASQFGASVALSASGTTALVGDPGAAQFGTATLYGYQSGSWPATPLAVPVNAGLFGTSVALSASGTTAAVGDPYGGLVGTGAVTLFSFDTTRAVTTVSPSASPSPAVVGSPVAYSATVTPQGGAPGPTGTVTFTDGLTTLCTATLSGGAGSCTTSATPAGHGTVFADYSGDAADGPSSGSTPLVVREASATAVSVQPASTTPGSPVTYSASVTPVAGPGDPTGSVTFAAGATALCTATLSGGAGSCTSAGAPVGADTVTGTYGGDWTYVGSDGTAPLDVVYPSATAVTVDPASTTGGSSVTYSATVTAPTGTPTGSVTFAVGATALCTATLSGGAGSCPSAGAPVGTDPVTGTYGGDTTHAGSAGGATLVVAPPATASVGLSQSTPSGGYGAAGQTIEVDFMVTNTGTTTLDGISVTDTPVTSVSCPAGTLAPGVAETCTGTYTLTQADVDGGSVTSVATASGSVAPGSDVFSSPSSMIVEASSATSSIGLAQSATSASYGAPGQSIAYDDVVTNTGTTTLYGVSIADPLVPSVSCPAGTLAPGVAETCTGTHTVTQVDLVAGSVTSVATASATDPHGTAVTSAAASVTAAASNCDPPVITSAATVLMVAGTPGSFTVTTCSTSPPVIKGARLPGGLHLVGNADGTATISGTPGLHDGGTYTATITASLRGQVPASQSLTVTVDAAPVFRSGAKATVRTGVAFAYPVTTAYGYPVPGLTTTSTLPDGVTLVDHGDGTGSLSGTPGAGAGGLYPITLTATNGVGAPVSQSFTLSVYQAPAITSPAADTVSAGAAMAPFTVTTTGYPVPGLRASGLPQGVHLTNNLDGTGTISGTPGPRDRTGAYTVTVLASGRAGLTSQTFILTVTP